MLAKESVGSKTQEMNYLPNLRKKPLNENLKFLYSIQINFDSCKSQEVNKKRVFIKYTLSLFSCHNFIIFPFILISNIEICWIFFLLFLNGIERNLYNFNF